MSAHQPYEGAATFHVDGTVYSICHLRLEVQAGESFVTTFGNLKNRVGGHDRVAIIVLERGDLPERATDQGELRLGDRQVVSASWSGDMFRL